jgi:DNA-binding response OmpR family regulator
MADDAPHVLVVEDDARTLDTIALYLRHGGFRVTAVRDGRDGLRHARSGDVDLVVLDLMLPGMPGLDVCRALREASRVPVILLTARTAEHDRLDGFAAGADDYVPKPFSPRELVARVRAVLRRAPPRDGAPGVLVQGEVEVDLAARRVRIAGRDVELTPSELAILAALASAPGRVLSRDQLLSCLPGGSPEGLDRTIDAHVKNLRKKIEPDPRRPRLVRTVFGAGYRLARAEEPPG